MAVDYDVQRGVNTEVREREREREREQHKCPLSVFVHESVGGDVRGAPGQFVVATGSTETTTATTVEATGKIRRRHLLKGAAAAFLGDVVVTRCTAG